MLTFRDLFKRSVEEGQEEIPFETISEFVDENTGDFYTISRRMPIHSALAYDANMGIMAIKTVALCVKREGHAMSFREVAEMDVKLFDRLIVEIIK